MTRTNEPMVDPATFGATPAELADTEQRLVQLRWLRDIEYFEGPLLSELVDGDGEPWLYYWCDCDETANRWLVFRPEPAALAAYMDGAASMLAVVDSAIGGEVLVVDTSGDDAVAAWRAALAQLPEDYKPGKNSYRRAA